MDTKWKNNIPNKVRFLGQHVALDGVPILIKFQSQYDYFQRSYSPCAYDLLDKYLLSLSSDKADFIYEEHESGPEIIVFLSLVTASVTSTLQCRK